MRPPVKLGGLADINLNCISSPSSISTSKNPNSCRSLLFI